MRSVTCAEGSGSTGFFPLEAATSSSDVGFLAVEASYGPVGSTAGCTTSAGRRSSCCGLSGAVGFVFLAAVSPIEVLGLFFWLLDFGGGGLP